MKKADSQISTFADFEQISDQYNSQLFLNSISDFKKVNYQANSKVLQNSNTKVSKTFIIQCADQDQIEDIIRLNMNNKNLTTLQTEKDFKWEELIRLKYLDLSYNNLFSFDGILSLCYLKELNLQKNNITNLNFLYKFPNLQKLILNDNSLDNIDGLLECKKLKHFEIKNNQITNIYNFINELKNLQHLRVLKVKGNQFSFDYFYKYEILIQIKQLTELDDEIISDADYQLSNQIYQNFFQYCDQKKQVQKENSQSFLFIKTNGFADKLRTLSKNYKNEPEVIENENIVQSCVFQKFDEEYLNKNSLDDKKCKNCENYQQQNNQLKIENQKQMAIIKQLQNQIDLLKNQQRIDSALLKQMQQIKDENKCLNEQKNFKINSKCESQYCYEQISILRDQMNLYLNEVIELKNKIQQEQNPKKLQIKQTQKFHIIKNKKQLQKQEQQVQISEQNLEQEIEDHQDMELESILMESLNKLSEAKTLLKDFSLEENKKVQTNFKKKKQYLKSSNKGLLPVLQKMKQKLNQFIIV